MQEQKSFEQTLLPYVEKVLKGLEKGIDYASEEIPIVLQQYVMYEAIISWILVGLGIIALVVGIFWLRLVKKEDPDYETPVIIFPTLWLILVPTALIGLNIQTAIQATFFPKLFLVKEFLNLL